MILILMIFSILSLLFTIATAFHAIFVSKKSVSNMERSSLALLSGKDIRTTAFDPYYDALNSELLTYELKPEIFIKSFLPNLDNILNDLTRCSTKAFFSFRTYYLSNPEMKWEYLINFSGAEKIKELTHSVEDVKSEEMYKTYFFIELKTIQNVNFEKDDNEIYSDMYYYDNKYGGVDDGKF